MELDARLTRTWRLLRAMLGSSREWRRNAEFSRWFDLAGSTWAWANGPGADSATTAIPRTALFPPTGADGRWLAPRARFSTAALTRATLLIARSGRRGTGRDAPAASSDDSAPTAPFLPP
ncbi:hypothetical protein LX15_000058 [Streptoalloteichus tenebrarius]|uniref:Uncharacterized protein n=1 Tax=Streptoalloteichus tenebrarius (strain ATCC 17920 / DSM 40477 / JCM 4838 / CBS 697.72 / NBRC 16177 / NCIMB 11028 / NRRL B-12390 / A12253. 1 / ISP 5477) TaxID=1933 RepID=A0ABT1HLJ1_STRSD|nr:hypothetical protein [Streptoalloteichus tenebrarius]